MESQVVKPKIFLIFSIKQLDIFMYLLYNLLYMFMKYMGDTI